MIYESCLLEYAIASKAHYQSSLVLKLKQKNYMNVDYSFDNNEHWFF